MKRWPAILALIGGLKTLGFAQSLPPIDTAPPKIAFPAWEEVSRPDYGIEYLVTFPSALVSGYPENDQVPLRVFMPANRTGRVPAVVVLHYWGATDLRVERTLAQELNRVGVAAAVMTLPYHLSRAPAGTRSGQMAIQPDPDKLRGLMVQAVMDTRRTIDYLATRPEIDLGHLGIFGTSLGALVASGSYGVDPRYTDASFLLGGVDLAGILWSSSRVVSQREALRKRGFTEDRLREALADIEPSTLLKRRTEGTTFVVGAKFDTVIPRAKTEQLIADVPDPKVLWIDTGHYGGIFVQRRLMRLVAKFFSEEFVGRTFQAPDRLYAPTVRIGLRYGTTGVDVTAGVDVWHFDSRGRSFANAMVTPRGVNLFIGQNVSSGLSVGGFVSTRGAGVGLFWSTVL